MTVIFYKCNDDPRKLDKTLAEISTKQCSVYGSCNVMNPSLLLKYDALIMDCNFFQVVDWGYYYMMNAPTLDNGMKMIVSGQLDIYTFRTEIKQLSATCIRNEGIGSPTYVPDSSFPLYPSSEYFTSVIVGEYFNMTTDQNFIISTK